MEKFFSFEHIFNSEVDKVVFQIIYSIQNGRAVEIIMNAIFIIRIHEFSVF